MQVLNPLFQRSILLLILLGASPALVAVEDWSVLMEPSQLAALLDSDAPVRVLRVSGDHAAGHIPGSVPASYTDFRGPGHNPGQLPDIEALTRTLRALGLEADTPVVLVHEGINPADMGTATRIYWTLKSLGMEQLAILNGGFLAWQAADLPISTEAQSVTPSDFSPQWQDTWQISVAEIESRLQDNSLRLVDARPPAFFSGEESNIARPGTISGAHSLPFGQWFEGGRLQDSDSIRSRFSASPLPAASETVSFCNSGHWASINWFVMSEVVGVPDTRLYAESMAEWTQARRPMDNEPSRLAYYWQMTRDWMSGLRE